MLNTSCGLTSFGLLFFLWLKGTGCSETILTPTHGAFLHGKTLVSVAGVVLLLSLQLHSALFPSRLPFSTPHFSFHHLAGYVSVLSAGGPYVLILPEEVFFLLLSISRGLKLEAIELIS